MIVEIGGLKCHRGLNLLKFGASHRTGMLVRFIELIRANDETGEVEVLCNDSRPGGLGYSWESCFDKKYARHLVRILGKEFEVGIDDYPDGSGVF